MADLSNFRPVSKADAAAAEQAGGEAPAPAPAPVAPQAEELPRYVGGKPRSHRVELQWPIEFRGRTYAAITLRRPNAIEVGRFFERLLELAASDPRQVLHFPIFVDDDGEPIPAKVIDFLDGDDEEAVMQHTEDFLPARFRRFREARRPASAPLAGANTGPTSSTL